jgi:hypothetical protein
MNTLQDDLELSLNTLIQEYGFIGVLNGLKHLVESKADAIGDPSDEQVEAFNHVSQILLNLVEELPEELDAKIALEHLTHVVPEVDMDDTKLASGLE